MKNTVIEILIPKGEPSSLRIIKLAGWIGRAFIIPRADLNEIKDMPEAAYPAVYFLFGEPRGSIQALTVNDNEFLTRVRKRNFSVASTAGFEQLILSGSNSVYPAPGFYAGFSALVPLRQSTLAVNLRGGYYLRQTASFMGFFGGVGINFY